MTYRDYLSQQDQSKVQENMANKATLSQMLNTILDYMHKQDTLDVSASKQASNVSPKISWPSASTTESSIPVTDSYVPQYDNGSNVLSYFNNAGDIEEYINGILQSGGK